MGCFSSGGSKQQSSSESKLEEQKALTRRAIDVYGRELGKNQDVWQGDRVTEFGDIQKGVLTAAKNYLGTFGTPQTAENALLGDMTTTTKSFLAGQPGAKTFSDEEFTNYFSETYRKPAEKRMYEDIIPGIAEDYAGPGFFGSSRSQAQTKYRTDLASELDQEEAAGRWANVMRNQDIDEAKAGRAQTAISQALSVGRAPAVEIMDNLNIAAQQIGGLNDLFGIGQAGQTQEQMELQADIMKFAEENAITDPQNLAILMALMDISFSSTSSSGSTWGPGLGYVGAGNAFQQAGTNLGNKFFV
jgi:hypothetical protein